MPAFLAIHVTALVSAFFLRENRYVVLRWLCWLLKTCRGIRSSLGCATGRFVDSGLFPELLHQPSRKI